MGYLMANHQLAAKIIETHPQHPANILDRDELTLLRAYVHAPADADKDALLRAHGIDPASLAEKTYSLVAYAIVHDKFDDGEKESLRKWFDDPQVEDDIEDPKYD
jgi:hypothetical protein